MRYLMILILAGCSTTQYVTPKIPLPAEPVYPTIKAAEYQCMAAESKQKLKTLIVQLNNAVDECRAVLEPYQ